MKHKKTTSLTRSIKWAYIMNWCEHGGSAFFMFALAAILGPEAFGSVAMAMVFINFMDMFLDQGFTAAIIQRKEINKAHLNSIFWLMLFVSVLLLAISLAVSGLWASLYNLPMLQPMVSALALLLPIGALYKVQQAELHRDSDFKKLSICNSLAVIVGGTIGLYMALSGFGVWSLVGQQLGIYITSALILWKTCNWKPSFQFHKDSVTDLFRFASGNFIAKVGVFISQHADALIIGFFFGPLALGYFRFATRVTSLVQLTLSRSIQTASLPALSRVQDNEIEFRALSKKFLRLSSILGIPAFICLAALSADCITLVGEDWLPAAPALIILCFSALIETQTQFTGPVLQALNKPFLLGALAWFGGAIGILTLTVFSYFLMAMDISQQVEGLAVAKLSISLALSLPTFVFVFTRLVKVNISEIILSLLPGIASASVGVSTIFLLSKPISSLVPSLYFYLPILVAIGALAIAATAYFSEPLAREKMRSISSKLFAKSR